MRLQQMWHAASSVGRHDHMCCQALHESVVCVPGYDYGLPASSPCGTYGAQNLCGADGSAVAMEGLRCTGAELTLSECTWASPSTACQSHEHDSIIFCGSWKEGIFGCSPKTARR